MSCGQILLNFCFFQLEYRMPLDIVRCRTLQATIWDCDRFQENMFLGAVTIPLNDLQANHEVTKWYPLTNYNRIWRSKFLIKYYPKTVIIVIFPFGKPKKISTIFDIVLCVYIIIYLAISAFLILSSLLLLKNHHRKNSYFEYWSQNGLNFLDLGLFLSETDADLLRTGLRWDWGIVFIFRLLQTWPQRTGAATC